MASAEIAEFERELQDALNQLNENQVLLRNNPDNKDLLEAKKGLEELIGILQSGLDDVRASQAPVERVSSPTEPEKWSKENHPAFQPGYRRPGVPATPVEETQSPTVFKVNDTVSAKWVTGDKAFYPARITSITGSSAAPVYTVVFKSYGNTETVRGNDIRPIANDSKKRKADDPPPPPAPAPSHGAPGVISAAPNINPELANQARREPSKVSDGPARPAKIPKKVKANKELEAGKSKWQEFTTKGKAGKAAKKESMFRTGESVNARVGFTGSGTAMRKDPTRSRHIYQPTEDDG